MEQANSAISETHLVQPLTRKLDLNLTVIPDTSEVYGGVNFSMSYVLWRF